MERPDTPDKSLARRDGIWLVIAAQAGKYNLGDQNLGPSWTGSVHERGQVEENASGHLPPESRILINPELGPIIAPKSGGAL